MLRKSIPQSRLLDSDLFIDALYQGGRKGNVSDDPIDPLIGGGNQGGFRYEGSPSEGNVRFCILYSDLGDPDWPDTLSPETGRFIYFGDNKRPGHELHETSRSGNTILRNIFEKAHSGNRKSVPPLFVFTKGYEYRDVIFRGLAVPGGPAVGQSEDLVAIWRTSNGQRFQNYRAIFTILDASPLRREWLNRVKSGGKIDEGAPEALLAWWKSGCYMPLQASRTRAHRIPKEQIPSDSERMILLDFLVEHYKAHPDREYAFEKCAAEIVKLMDANVSSIDLTRPWRDGGRDGIGKYRIGTSESSVLVDFALEAKCMKPSSGNCCGVKLTSRLISRLKYRQFGVFVTTSCVGEQAYQEIVEDGHPVLIIAGVDIVEILRRNGISTITELQRWLAGTD